ncbi:MAG: EF-hand domain-containing protein [Methylocystis sp.]
MKTRTLLISSLLVGLGLLAAPVATGSKAFAASSLVETLDRDSDRTLDLDEVTKAASAVYDRLDKDHDGTLDRKEAGSRIDRKEFSAADTDHDGTLSKDEYLALVEKLFKKADTNNDGTLDAKELRSKAGRALARLLR